MLREGGASSIHRERNFRAASTLANTHGLLDHPPSRMMTSRVGLAHSAIKYPT
jgi:hypothetical protein